MTGYVMWLLPFESERSNNFSGTYY